MADVISGITKEPDEVKYKGIDLSNWLETEEELESLYVYAYEVTDATLKGFDLNDVQYIDVKTYDEDHNVQDAQTEWEMADKWDEAKLMVQGSDTDVEITDEIVVDETGSSNPNEWIDQVTDNKFRIGIRAGELGRKYHIMVQFSTSAGRVEKVHFPVEIIEVSDV